MGKLMQFVRPNFTDRELIKNAIAGDKQAFGFLYERYLNDIYKYLLYRMDSAEDAEDLAETVFMKAWLAMPVFKPGSGDYEFKAWLFRIAHNALMDHYRTEKHSLQIDQTDLLPDDQPGAEQKLVFSQTNEQLMDALHSIDELSQQVMLLRFLAGLKSREVGEVLGLTEGNVRLIQYRAIKMIQKKMGVSHE
jgi:RNA polymerase sigma-70 factor (ECF subfamily)